jgi:hypothetical protein
MKKEYIEPQMEVLNGELQQMICVSVPVEETATTGEGGWGGPQSLDADFEEE